MVCQQGKKMPTNLQFFDKVEKWTINRIVDLSVSKTEVFSMDKTINVSGMHCKSCEMLLADSISEIKGVEKVNADSKKGTVTVSLQNDSILDNIKKTIEKEGYKVI